MTKVIRTTPIDRSKRTAVKGDVVGEINIIHGKRKRKLSSNFAEYVSSSEMIIKPKSPKQNKSKTKKNKKELSDSDDVDEDGTSMEENPVIYLNTGKSKFEVVDMDETKEEREEDADETTSLFSQEIVQDQSRSSKNKKKSKDQKKNKQHVKETSPKKKEKPIFVEELPPSTHSELPFDPLQYFSERIVECVKKLGGTFPATYNRNLPFVYGSQTYERFDESMRLFTCINWNNHLCKYQVLQIQMLNL